MLRLKTTQLLTMHERRSLALGFNVRVDDVSVFVQHQPR
jgi:hypothetical protein